MSLGRAPFTIPAPLLAQAECVSWPSAAALAGLFILLGALPHWRARVLNAVVTVIVTGGGWVWVMYRRLTARVRAKKRALVPLPPPGSPPVPLPTVPEPTPGAFALPVLAHTRALTHDCSVGVDAK
jgi:hypothetical protein